MKTVKRSFILAAIFFLPSWASALDLNDCVKMALEGSHALRSSQSARESASAAYARDRKAVLPVLSVTGEESYNHYQSIAGLPDGRTEQVGAQFSWDLRKVLSNYPETSRIELEKSRILEQLAERDVVRSVTQDYYRLYILLGKRADYSEARDYFSSHIQDISKLEAAGLDMKLDRVRAEIQLKALELTARDLETDISGVLKSLSSAAGRELHAEEIGFEGGAEALGSLPGLEPAAVSTCCAADPALFSLRLGSLETKSAFEAYRQSKFFYAPTVQLGAARGLEIIDPATELNRTYLTISLDVFDFGAHREERKAFLRGYEARREAELEDQRRLRLALDRLAEEIAGAAEAYAGLKRNSEAAAGNLETAKTYYRQGKIKETDLLSIFSEYLDAKQQSRDALGRYFDKKAELAYLQAGAVK